MNDKNLIKKDMEGKAVPLAFTADFLIAKKYDLKKSKKASDSEGTFIIEGYASTSDIDSQYSIITEKAIADGATSLQKYTTLLFNHDMNRPIGKIQLAEARGNKLFVKCSISKSEADIREKIQDGTLSKFSIMGEVLEGDDQTIDGQDLFVINSLRLFEVSLVSVPANVEAKALNWYIEKSLLKNGSILSRKKNVDMPEDKDEWEDEEEEEENKKEKKALDGESSDIDHKELLSACNTILEQMETVVAGLVGDDRDNGVRVVQWLQAIKEKYDPSNGQAVEDENSEDEKKAQKKLEELNVKRNSDAKEKDYVTVLDESTEDVTKDATETVTKSVDVADEDVVLEKTVEVEKEAKVEKEVVKSEVVKTTATEINDETALVKSLTGVIAEIKELAKSVVVAVDDANKAAKEALSAKEELQKSLDELKETLKGVPIRKVAAITATQDGEDRLESEEGTDTREILKRKNKNFDNLPPQEQLRQIVAEQLKGKGKR